MLPLKVHGADTYVQGATFDRVLELYLFDREFRLLLFDTIEKIEIAFRTQMSYRHSLAHGPFWFVDQKHFIDANLWRKHLKDVDSDVERAKEVFKDHFFSKYDEEERMPIWMTSEVLSFGTLSKIFRNLVNSPEKKDISQHFGIGNPKVLESWLQVMTYTRNICAHHGRLWNRILTNKPTNLARPTNVWLSSAPRNDKSYFLICCFLYMLRAINPNTRFVTKFKNLLGRYPTIDKKAMGFPDKWDEDPFWNT
jgi:abortive infection bacteriophage resistance protein